MTQPKTDAAADRYLDLEWIIYPTGTDQSLAHWLQEYPPSRITRAQGVGWIYVKSPNWIQDDECDPSGLLESFQQLVKSGRGVTEKTMRELAHCHHVLEGKWMFHASTGLKIDYMWQLVAKATVAGKLGQSAKVSPVGTEGSSDFYNKTHVVCIYVSNYTNMEEVIQLEAAIRGIGIKASLTFKPDAYTHVGIYRENEWGLRPTIYKSQFDILQNVSIVENI